MHKQDLEGNTASLSHDEIVKILRDLAVHPDTENSIMAALESSQSSQPRASDSKKTTRHSFLSRVLERIRQELHRETAPKAKPSDVQVCDNCHKLFRISTAKNYYHKGCWGHPGRLEDLQKVVRDEYRFEQVKRRYAVQDGAGPIHYKCWTCCLGTKSALACNWISCHVCHNPVSEVEASSA